MTQDELREEILRVTKENTIQVAGLFEKDGEYYQKFVFKSGYMEAFESLAEQIRQEAVEGFTYQIGMNMGFDWMSLDEHAEVQKWLNAQAEAYLTQSKEEGGQG